MKHSVRGIISLLVGSGLLICLAGCGGGNSGPGLTNPPGPQAAVRGTVSLNIMWSPKARGTRYIPDSAVKMRVELVDGLGEYKSQEITRPAEGTENAPVQFEGIAGRKVVVTAVAFSAQDLPVAWGRGTAYVYSAGEQSSAEMWLDGTTYSWWQDPESLKLATGELHWKATGKPVIGGWQWEEELLDTNGQPVIDPYYGGAEVFVAAGGTVYVVFLPQAITAIQVPVIGEDDPYDYEFVNNRCPFAAKYIPLQLTAATTYDLGVIEVESLPADVPIN